MWETTLSKYLRSYYSINNPFLNKNFFISAIETNENLKKYLVNNVEISFYNLKCKILSNNDFIIAAFLALSIEDNAFGFDPNSELYINNKKIIYDKNSDISIKFKKIENILKSETYEIIYSDTENGHNAFEYNKSLIWFIIDENHDDDFYLNKTLKQNKL